MAILAISGSTSLASSNTRLLKALPMHFDKLTFLFSPDLGQLPLFSVDRDKAPYHTEVAKWRLLMAQSTAIVISTPAYLHNIPAVLKNALEWVTTSGELYAKPVLAITYTPHPPRGEEAMQSLLWSLGALNARVVAQCPLYQNEFIVNDDGTLTGRDSIDMLEEALLML